jgi:hypothetical protein
MLNSWPVGLRKVPCLLLFRLLQLRASYYSKDAIAFIGIDIRQSPHPGVVVN